MVSQKASLADDVSRGPATSVVLLATEQRLHVLAVWGQDAAVVRLRVATGREPPHVRVRVLEAFALHCHPLSRCRKSRGVVADDVLAEMQVGGLLERQQRPQGER